MAQNKLTLIDQIQTLAWFNFVTQTSKMNANRIGLALSHDEISGHGSNKCYQWKVGKHKPHKESVAKVESLVPGSLNFFYHPLWNILSKPDEIREIGDVEKLLAQIPKAKTLLFKKILPGGNKATRKSQPIDHEHVCELCDVPYRYTKNSARNLDMIAIQLLLVHEAKTLNSRRPQSWAMSLFKESKSKFKKIPELIGLDELIFNLIEQSELWKYLEPEESPEHVQFMRDLQLGLEMDTDPPYHWTPAQEALLGTMSDKALARRLGLTKNMVWFRRYQLGILEFFCSPKKLKK
jgi:hypothetical protein